MPKIYEIATGEKGPGNIINETVLSQGGATTATTPAFTDDRNLDTSTNTAPTVRRFKRRTTGTPANGIGAGIDFEVQTGAANFEVGASIQAIATDVTAGSEDFDIVFRNMAAGAAAAETFRINSSGDATVQRILAVSTVFQVSGASSTAYLGSTGRLSWTSGSASGVADIGLSRKASGVLQVNTGTVDAGGAMEWREQTAPAAPSTNGVRVYAQDNGAGKTQLMALFPTGAAQQVAIEP